MSRPLHIPGLIALVILVGTGPASAEPADLPALEKAWHGCVLEAYDRQHEQSSRAARERNALDECKPHEDRYVVALMAARPEDDPDMLVGGWARTWAAYVGYVVDPVKLWIDALRR